MSAAHSHNPYASTALAALTAFSGAEVLAQAKAGVGKSGAATEKASRAEIAGFRVEMPSVLAKSLIPPLTVELTNLSQACEFYGIKHKGTQLLILSGEGWDAHPRTKGVTGDWTTTSDAAGYFGATKLKLGVVDDKTQILDSTARAIAVATAKLASDALGVLNVAAKDVPWFARSMVTSALEAKARDVAEDVKSTKKIVDPVVANAVTAIKEARAQGRAVADMLQGAFEVVKPSDLQGKPLESAVLATLLQGLCEGAGAAGKNKTNVMKWVDAVQAMTANTPTLKGSEVGDKAGILFIKTIGLRAKKGDEFRVMAGVYEKWLEEGG